MDKKDTTTETWLAMGKQRPTTGRCFAIGMGLLTATLTPVVLATIGWACGTAICGWMFPAGVAAGLATVYALSRSAKTTLLVLAYVAASLVGAGLLFDYTYDANSYHKVAVIAMAEGWNPIAQPEIEGVLMWVIHYAKLMEILQATVLSATGLLEQAKGVNMMLFGMMAAFGYDFFRRTGLSRRMGLAATFVALANPVMLTQLPTFYIDFVMYVDIATSIALMGNIAANYHRRLSAAALLGITLIAIGTKFNAFFFQGLTLMAGMGWMALRRDSRSVWTIAWVGLIALAITPALFYHPYVSNLTGWGNPLYPLLGEGAVDIMTNNTPAEFAEGGNRFVNFFASLFGIDWRLFPFTNYDSRVAGFTLLGGTIVAVSIGILGAAYIKGPGRDKRRVEGAIYVAACAIASCFIFAETWWARYIPQLWLVPAASFYCLAAAGPRLRRGTWAMLALIGAATMLSGGAQLAATVGKTRQIHAVERQLKGKRVEIAESYPTDIYMLERWGVECVKADSLEGPCEDIPYFSGHARIRIDN